MYYTKRNMVTTVFYMKIYKEYLLSRVSVSTTLNSCSYSFGVT